MRRILAGPLVVTALTLAACGSAAPGAPEPARPAGPTVVASTNVYGSIAQAVGGDLATVQSLINDPAADPHTYESTPADALAVGNADIVVVNGGGYDAFMPGLVRAAGGQPTVIDVAALSGIEGAGGFNEHLWYSLPTVQKLATRLATDLGAADPADAATYAANAEAFNAKVRELVVKVEDIEGTHRGVRVAVTEPLPGYLITQAGLVDATPAAFTEAVEEDTDPPAAVVVETLALFTGSQKAQALILDAQTRTPVTDQVRRAAEAADVPVVEMSETLPAGAGDYVTWMGRQVDALAAALDAGRTP